MLDILFLLTLSTTVYAEGYYCPYSDLGSTQGNELLYDYYNDNDGTYWTRKGETGWMTVSEYCKNKGDTSLHSDAGEWKCNDSHLLCTWNGSSCNVNPNRNPDCKDLCIAVLNNMGPECLGNCPGGSSSNTLYSQFCEPKTHHTHKKDNTNKKRKKNRCRRN